MIECTFGWIGSMSFKCWHTKWHTIIIKYMYFTFHRYSPCYIKENKIALIVYQIKSI